MESQAASAYRAITERLQSIRQDWCYHHDEYPHIRFVTSPAFWHEVMQTYPGVLFKHASIHSDLMPDEIAFQDVVGKIDYRIKGHYFLAWIEEDNIIHYSPQPPDRPSSTS